MSGGRGASAHAHATTGVARVERPLPIRPVVVATIQRPHGETGVHTHIRNFLRWADGRGIQARLVTPFHAHPALIYPLFAVGRFAKPFSKPFWAWWYRWTHRVMLERQLARELRGAVPSIVYAQDPESARAAIALRDAGYGIEVVLMVHFNGSEADELVTWQYISRGGRLYEAIRRHEREVMARVDRAIFASRFVAEQTGIRINGDDEGRFWHIPNSVRQPDIAAGLPTRDLITIGSLEPRKNQEFILRVLDETRRRGRCYTLTVVGSGPLGPKLRSLARRLDLERDVVFTGYRPDATSLLADHRVYVHAALVENCPMVVLEALAAGRPIMAAPVGGVPEVMSDGVEGMFWALDDPATAAERLTALLDSPTRYGRMARAARIRYERDFTPATQSQQVLRALMGRERGVLSRIELRTMDPP